MSTLRQEFHSEADQIDDNTENLPGSMGLKVANMQVLKAWLERGRLSHAIDLYCEEYNAEAGDEWILLISYYCTLQRADDELDRLWHAVITRRYDIWHTRTKNEHRYLTGKRKEMEPQWEGPLERRYGDLDTHLWSNDSSLSMLAPLLWALKNYEKALHTTVSHSAVLEDDTLKKRYDWIFAMRAKIMQHLAQKA